MEQEFGRAGLSWGCAGLGGVSGVERVNPPIYEKYIPFPQSRLLKPITMSLRDTLRVSAEPDMQIRFAHLIQNLGTND